MERPSRSRAMLEQAPVVVVELVVLVDVDQGGDVARRRLREAAGDGLPVPLHEGEGDDAFEQHDRRDDDDEQARA